MTKQDQIQLGKTLWAIADELRGAMNADDFRDYMLAFLFLRYLSDNYEEATRSELGADWPELPEDERRSPLVVWYEQNQEDRDEFEEVMHRKVHYVIKPEYLWGSIAEMARTQNGDLLRTLQQAFKFIENESFSSNFQGLFSEINLDSEKLGRDYKQRNDKLCTIIQKIAEGLAEFPSDRDLLGDAYEYLIGQFAAGSGKKAGEFYTPQQISSILSGIVSLDGQDPSTGKKRYRWQPNDELAEDFRFKGYGLAPKSAADFAFLLHGFHFLHKEGTMAIILPHGVLFRGGAEAKIRKKLLLDGNIDTVIGLPAKLFYSTGIPVCILVLKKCKKFDDVLVINAAEHFEKGKRQNVLLPEHIDKVVETYRYRKEEERYSRRVSMEEIEENGFNLNISRYVSTAKPEPPVDLAQVHTELTDLAGQISEATRKHNEFLRELGLPGLP